MIVGGSMEMLSGWIKGIEASHNPENIRSGRHWHSCSARPTSGNPAHNAKVLVYFRRRLK